MPTTHFAMKAVDPAVITFALAICFAATCALAIVATSGVLGS